MTKERIIFIDEQTGKIINVGHLVKINEYTKRKGPYEWKQKKGTIPKDCPIQPGKYLLCEIIPGHRILIPEDVYKKL